MGGNFPKALRFRKVKLLFTPITEGLQANYHLFFLGDFSVLPSEPDSFK
jgi:hypothetical protein